MMVKKLVLLIVDGFGVPPMSAMRQSPFVAAQIPTIHHIEKWYPFTTLQASGIGVGLPVSMAGNSEVGHLTIGAGRTVYQHLPRIISAIEDGSFFENQVLTDALRHIRAHGGTLHLAGLFSNGTVHAYKKHAYALVDFAGQKGIPTMLHLFGDGKDGPPKEFAENIKELRKYIERQGYNNITIASVMGRDFAMDRGKRWGKLKKAYDCLVGVSAEPFSYASAYVEKRYTSGEEDINITPGWRVDGEGKSIGRVGTNDALFFYNFREDSMREIVRAFAGLHFDGFARKKIPNLFIGTMTDYAPDVKVHVAFPRQFIESPLARVLSDEHKSQLHIAESEKEAHVTYFFNGGREEPYEREERIIVPSPKVEHYDLLPEMAIDEVAHGILQGIEKHDVVIANFANADMVGHTGNYDATLKAIEAIDQALARIMEAVMEIGGALLITSDHGNAEMKRNLLTGRRRTHHTTNVVPFYIVHEKLRRGAPRTHDQITSEYQTAKGVLADVAPTLLALMNIRTPGVMNGENLLDKMRG